MKKFKFYPKKSILNLLIIATSLFLFSCEKPDLKIGFIATLSGRKADLGVHARNGAQLAIKNINAQGGINGRKIFLNIFDDKDNPNSAQKAFRELVSEEPDFIIGPVTSVMGDAIYNLITESGIPVISPSVTSSAYYGRKDNFYLMMPSNSAQGKRIAEYIRMKGYINNLGVIDISNRSYAEGIINDTATNLEKLKNDQIIYSISGMEFDSTSDVDYKDLARRFIRMKPDSIVMACSGADAALITQSLELEGYSGPLIGSTWAMSIDAIPLLGNLTDRMRYIGLANPSNQTERYIKFKDDYTHYFNMYPLHVAAFAYDSVELIRKAVLEGRDSHSNASEVFTNLTVTTGCLIDFSVDKNGDSNRQVYITKIKGQGFVLDEQAE